MNTITTPHAYVCQATWSVTSVPQGTSYVILNMTHHSCMHAPTLVHEDTTHQTCLQDTCEHVYASCRSTSPAAEDCNPGSLYLVCCNIKLLHLTFSPPLPFVGCTCSTCYVWLCHTGMTNRKLTRPRRGDCNRNKDVPQHQAHLKYRLYKLSDALRSCKS